MVEAGSRASAIARKGGIRALGLYVIEEGRDRIGVQLREL